MCNANPASAAPAKTFAIPMFSQKTAINAIADKAAAIQSIEAMTGSWSDTGPA